MTTEPSGTSRPFFVAGGTVPPGSASYVERAADRELFEALLEGEFCYVLNSRQMGKSSLAVRTIAKLQEAGVRTAFVDLTRLGAAGATPEKWYAGLLLELGRALGMRAEAVEAIKAEGTPAGRLFGFLTDLLGENLLVVFVDEVDATRTLPFPADDLFAGIRQAWNARATDPRYASLAFCLMGAALPGDLIRDPRVTPFNVGRRVELRDFAPEEASPFESVVGKDALDRVLHWTGGHPFLTQSLCAELAFPIPGSSPATRHAGKVSVDALVRSRYLDARARETDTNLADVGNRLLGNGDPNVTDEERATTLALYERMLRGKAVADDESNPSAARIKMSGVVRPDNGLLRLRNEIYRQVFDARWVRENTPGQEFRRQRRAFWRGALRTAAISALLIFAFAALALVAVLNADRARRLETQARRNTYVATMRNMASLRDQSNLSIIDAALAGLERDPWKGWEWRYWNRVAHRARRTIDLDRTATGWFHLSPDGKYGVSVSATNVFIIDVSSGSVRAKLPKEGTEFTVASWMRDSRRFLTVTEGEGTVAVYDAAEKRMIRRESVPGLDILLGSPCTLPGDHKAVAKMQDGRFALLDLATFRLSPLAVPSGALVSAGLLGSASSPDGRTLYTALAPGGARAEKVSVYDLTTQGVRSTLKIGQPVSALALSGDGRVLAVGTYQGDLFTTPVSDPSRLSRVHAFSTPIVDLSLTEDGRKVVAAGRNRESALFRLHGGGLAPEQRFAESNGAKILPDASQVVTEYDQVRFYDVRAEPEVPEVALGEGFYAADISARGEWFAGGSPESWMVNLRSQGSPPVRIPFRGGFDADSGLLLRAGESGAEIRDAKTGRLRRTLALPPDEAVGAFAVSPDGRLAARGGPKGFWLFPLDSNGPIRRIDAGGAPTALRFSPDGRFIAVALSNGTVELFAVATGGSVWRDDEPHLSEHILSFSADGSYLAAAGDSDTGRVWQAKSGRRLYEMVGHSQTVRALAWSPDGRRIATGGDDRTVHLWDASTGQDLGIIGRHANGVAAVRFLSGGRTLASASQDGVAKLWMTEARR